MKKKDKTWCFCVDFRHLNAITAKTKYHVPIIDELLDELAGAIWFSSLDLTAGYHPIHLKDGATPKMAFQTHLGHYEFKVMVFGLSGAPSMFQLAMNTTLAPVLRKCALVFLTIFWCTAERMKTIVTISSWCFSYCNMTNGKSRSPSVPLLKSTSLFGPYNNQWRRCVYRP